LRKEDMAKSDTYDSSWDREGNEDAWNTKIEINPALSNCKVSVTKSRGYPRRS
jgi:hypothetical protein